MSKSTSKIIKKPSQNGVPGDPGGARGPPESGSLLGAGRDGFWIATKYDEGFEAFRACPGGHFGSRPGPQNRPKIDLWRKRWPRRKCREAFFIDFQCHRCFGSVFASVFDGFLMFFVCFLECFCLQFLYHFSFQICSKFCILSMTFWKQWCC